MGRHGTGFTTSTAPAIVSDAWHSDLVQSGGGSRENQFQCERHKYRTHVFRKIKNIILQNLEIVHINRFVFL